MPSCGRQGAASAAELDFWTRERNSKQGTSQLRDKTHTGLRPGRDFAFIILGLDANDRAADALAFKQHISDRGYCLGNQDVERQRGPCEGSGRLPLNFSPTAHREAAVM